MTTADLEQWHTTYDTAILAGKDPPSAVAKADYLSRSPFGGGRVSDMLQEFYLTPAQEHVMAQAQLDYNHHVRHSPKPWSEIL